MEEGYAVGVSLDMGTRLRDLEEKHRLLRDRILLIGQTLMKEREKNSKDLQEVKRSLIILQEESVRIRELLERVTEQLQEVARKEEVMILQRQFDLFRGK